MPSVRRRGSFAEVVVVDSNGEPPAGQLLLDFVERTGLGWHQVAMTPLLVGVFVAEGAVIFMTNTCSMAMQREFNFSDRESSLLPSYAFIGLAVGTLASGILGDIGGRRGTVLASLFGSSLYSITLAVAVAGFDSAAFYLFASSACCGLGVSAAITMLLELYPRRHRSVPFAIAGCAYTLGEIYAGLGLLVWMPDLVHGTWRAVSLWVAFPSAIFFTLSLRFLGESPQWLAVHGRFPEARGLLLTAARRNSTSHKVDTLLDASDDQSGGALVEAPGWSFLPVLRSLLASRRLMVSFVTCSLLCIVGNLLTFGMSYFWPMVLHFHEGGADAALALIKIRCWGLLAALVAIPIFTSSLGHRWIIFISGLVSACGLQQCSRSLLQDEGARDDARLVYLAGSVVVAGSVYYSCVMTLTSESFPTEVRAFASGCCLCAGRLGSVLAPLALWALSPRNFLSFCALSSLAAGLLGLFVRDTKGIPLEDFCEGHLSPSATAAKALPL